MQDLLRLRRHAREMGDTELVRLIEERLGGRPASSLPPPRRPATGPDACVERLARALGLRG
ncbi:MAG TPA: hypothetical protein VNT32_00820 [Thermoleophilaceae bacterium]|nr:hypothetical protein [Thermoleophilaceae bacterium]